MSDGSRHSLRIVRETVRGTTPASPAMKTLRNTGVTLGLAKEILQSEEIRDDRMIADIRHGAFNVGGDINFELSAKSYDEELEAVLMGTWTANVLKAGAVRRFHTIERYFADQTTNRWHRFTGCEFNTMNLQINANAMVTGSFGIVGQGMSLANAALTGATYPAPSTTSPLDSFTGALQEGGSPVAVVTELGVNLQNGLDPRYVVGSKSSILPSVGRSNCNLNLTVFFEDSVMLEKFINETVSSLRVTLPDGAGNSYEHFWPRIKYTGGQPDVSGEGPITLSMPCQALYDPVTGTNYQITRTLAP